MRCRENSSEGRCRPLSGALYGSLFTIWAVLTEPGTAGKSQAGAHTEGVCVCVCVCVFEREKVFLLSMCCFSDSGFDASAAAITVIRRPLLPSSHSSSLGLLDESSSSQKRCINPSCWRRFALCSSVCPPPPPPPARPPTPPPRGPLIPPPPFLDPRGFPPPIPLLPKEIF